MDETIVTDTKKKSRWIFYTFLLLVVLCFLVFLYLFLGNSIIGKVKDILKLDKSEKSVVTNESVFSSLVQTQDGGEYKSPNENNDINDNKMLAVTYPDKYAYEFLFNNRQVDPSQRPYLARGEIAIEFFSNNGVFSYKLIGSNNPIYKHTVGEEVSFEPTFNSGVLIVQKDQSIILNSNEIHNYKIPDSLVSGDKIVFLCQHDDCSDGSIIWALVFRVY